MNDKYVIITFNAEGEAVLFSNTAMPEDIVLQNVYTEDEAQEQIDSRNKMFPKNTYTMVKLVERLY